jgi:hypothetical protein
MKKLDQDEDGAPFKSAVEKEKAWMQGQRDDMHTALAEGKLEYEERMQRNDGRNTTEADNIGHAGTLTASTKNRAVGMQEQPPPPPGKFTSLRIEFKGP